MAKANPKAWFPGGWMAKIFHRKVDRYAASMARWKPYFPTWAEAHKHMLEKSGERLKKAKAELRAATAFDTKVRALQAPEQPQEPT